MRGAGGPQRWRNAPVQGQAAQGRDRVGDRQVCVELGPCAANTIFQHSALQHLARRRQLCPS